MSVSAAQRTAFFDEAVRYGEVFTIRDDGGFPAPMTHADVRAQPFWSRKSRAEQIIATVDAYAGFAPVRVSLDDFRERWLPGLSRDGLRVGVNWSGGSAAGYDMTPDEVLAWLSADGRR